MRYCGNCGGSLNFAALASGSCPACGATIGPDGDPIAPVTAPLSSGTPETPGPAGTLGAFPPPPQPPGGQPASRGRRRATPLAIVALAAAVVVLSGTLALGWGRLGHAGAPSQGTGGAAGSATQAQGITPLVTRSAQPSAQPSVSADPTITAAGTLTVTSTSTLGDQPVLTVDPTTIVMACLQVQAAQFDVRNSGGGTLNWTAVGVAFLVNPPAGSLPAGQQQAVQITSIGTPGGQITVTAPGAANSPQTVTITCTG